MLITTALTRPKYSSITVADHTAAAALPTEVTEGQTDGQRTTATRRFALHASRDKMNYGLSTGEFLPRPTYPAEFETVELKIILSISKRITERAERGIVAAQLSKPEIRAIARKPRDATLQQLFADIHCKFKSSQAPKARLQSYRHTSEKKQFNVK